MFFTTQCPALDANTFQNILQKFNMCGILCIIVPSFTPCHMHNVKLSQMMNAFAVAWPMIFAMHLANTYSLVNKTKQKKWLKP